MNEQVKLQLPYHMIMVKNYKEKDVVFKVYPERNDLLTDFGKATLKDRYLQKGEDYQDLFARVAGYYSEDSAHAQKIYDYISKLWFMPATPILSNGGTDRGFPISCFLNSVGDSLESIFEAQMESGWLAARGGGIGTGWGAVRSLGEKIADVGKTSGIIPFLKVQDSATLAISQGSLRRGSSAAYLPVNHPEIEDFIDIRRPTGGDPNRKATNIHHGVVIEDAFMKAVEVDGDYDLISPKTGEVMKTVKARNIFTKILMARVETGEPYMVFSGTANRGMSDAHKELGLKVTQSNLCAEIMLPTGEDHLGGWRTAVCCLSSVNLEHFEEWENHDYFINDVMVFLDNVLTDFINKTDGIKGFERARYSAIRERSVGLGTMGFHGFLQKKNVPFESVMSKVWNKRIYKNISDRTKESNLNMGQVRGACPDNAETGRAERFSYCTALAPTASISIIAGGATPGIDPATANSYTQKTLSGSFNVRSRYLDDLIVTKLCALYPSTEQSKKRHEEIWSEITVNEGSIQNMDFFTDVEKEVFKTSFEIDQDWVIQLAADRAPLVDQAQSVNLFIPADIDKTKLMTIHYAAWKRGLKSLYYCRSKSIQRADVVSTMPGTMPTENQSEVRGLIEDEGDCLVCQ